MQRGRSACPSSGLGYLKKRKNKNLSNESGIDYEKSVVGTLKGVTFTGSQQAGQEHPTRREMLAMASLTWVSNMMWLVSVETNYILDGVKKSMVSRMVQPQERACYKHVEKRGVHTTCRDDEPLTC